MKRLIRAVIIGVAGMSLGACAYGDLGHGSVGISSGGYYGSGYDSRYYDNYGYNRTYRYPAYYGWYDNYYYPGQGIYVYDRRGDRHRWRDNDRRHWEGRRAEFRRWRSRNPHVQLDRIDRRMAQLERGNRRFDANRAWDRRGDRFDRRRDPSAAGRDAGRAVREALNGDRARRDTRTGRWNGNRDERQIRANNRPERMMDRQRQRNERRGSLSNVDRAAAAAARARAQTQQRVANPPSQQRLERRGNQRMERTNRGRSRSDRRPNLDSR
ncbi:hypothetical protein ACSMXM_00910 [Pacificimonas sp. ICDLI1SI03]